MYVTKRSGFAMILAIFVVVLVALGGVMLLGNAAMGSKSIGDNYLKAQAELLAMSATEFAVMRAQGFDRTGNHCLENLNITVQSSSAEVLYDANVSLAYSFRGASFPGCTAAHVLSPVAGTGKDTMILMDVTVTTRDAANLSTEPIRVHKRSWQKL